ncbi:MAG TPA: glycine--tRNA ligase subunit beta [Gammaproteobacteria bacterium]|nr:glycine--tRNA ligase subunit beta [Pseudomonadota bacterium]HAY46738.1 glycine--tRNA ligase subunit beta [Gammaproteobacteria bacterium]
MSHTDSLLIELGTEELPPKALLNLATAFSKNIHQSLQQQNLISESGSPYKTFATPRRLAVLINNVPLKQKTQTVERRGPSLKAAFDSDGNPSKATLGFAGSCGVKFDELDRLETDDGSWLVHRSEQEGRNAEVIVIEAIEQSIKQLPIPKRMRWGDSDIEFVRPAHWVVTMLGTEVLQGTVLGLSTNRITQGHRFHADKSISLKHADDYVDELKNAHVIASFDARQEMIRGQINALDTPEAKAVIDYPDSLINEVTALVEWPHLIVGEFDDNFLSVPSECLIYSMRDHQKYFHYIDDKGALINRFATISNIDSSDPSSVRAGNERVLRARLSDARFFWETDCKTTLAKRLPSLDGVLFHAKLGSVAAKSERISALAEKFATDTGANKKQASRAGLLAKADLTSSMVGEFPELQGIAGRYFATNDGEPQTVSTAIEQHYQPKYGGGDIPENSVGQTVALADKIDTLVGIFAAGEEPSGEKDPYALRRAALGVLRILIETNTSSTLEQLVENAADEYQKQELLVSEETQIRVVKFTMERLRKYYLDRLFSSEQINSVMACTPLAPLDFQNRLEAVRAFAKLPEATQLAAANKRISNILRKSEHDTVALDETLLNEDAEKALAAALQTTAKEAEALFDKSDYEGGLSKLASLRPVIDTFFDQVMVNADDEATKNNRLSLLASIQALFLRTADISVLQ